MPQFVSRRFLPAALLAAGGLLWLAVAAGTDPRPVRAAGEKKPASAGPGGSRSGRPTTRPGGPPSPSRYRRYSRPLTKEQEQEVLQFLKKKRPELYEQVIESRQKDPRRYQRTLHMMWGYVSRLKQLPKKVADAYEVRQQTHVKMWRTARDLLAAKDEAEKQRLEARLEELGAVAFDADQVIREHRLTELAEQIRRLKAELQARAQDRQARIREMIEWIKRGARAYQPGRTPPPPPPPPGRDGPRPAPARDSGQKHPSRPSGRH